MRKLIAVDIDGTLLNDDLYITKKTKEALIKAQQQGHKVVISSGRAPFGIIPFAYELEMDKFESYISGQNGSRVVDVKTKEVVIDHFLDLNLSKEILKFASDLGIDYMIYVDDLIYALSEDTYKLKEVQQKNNNSEIIVDPNLLRNLSRPINNILFAQEPAKIIDPASKILEKFSGKAEMMFSSTYFFEVMPKGVSKGHALKEISQYLEIDRKDIIAFGDQENDISMLKIAGVGVAMENAVEELKDVADYITKSNNEDGIAKFLEENIL